MLNEKGEVQNHQKNQAKEECLKRKNAVQQHRCR
jgi:hypothetical protein